MKKRPMVRARMVRKTAILVLVVAASAVGPGVCSSGGSVSSEIATGFVVNTVTPQEAVEWAGLRPGDVVTGWRKPGQTQIEPLTGILDLWELESQVSPFGPIELVGDRNGRSMCWTVQSRLWGVEYRPQMKALHLGWFVAGRDAITAGDVDAGVASWRGILDAVVSADFEVAIWIANEIARAHEKAFQFEEADSAWLTARRLVEAARPEMLASQLEVQGRLTVVLRRRPDRAGPPFEEALALRRRDGEHGLAEARLLMALGDVAFFAHQYELSRERHELALEAFRGHTPYGFLYALALFKSGFTHQGRGDLATAEQIFLDALSIYETWFPDTRLYPMVMDNLGYLTTRQGRLADAERWFRRGLELKNVIAPGEVWIADAAIGLGNVSLQRGKLADAERSYQQALVLYQKLMPGRAKVGWAYGSLGRVEERRGNYQLAEFYDLRAKELFFAHNAADSDSATILGNLGVLAAKMGHWESAEEYFTEARTAHHALAPGGLDEAVVLASFGEMAFERGRTKQAGELLREALEIQRQRAPGSLQEARTSITLGEVALVQGEQEEAAEWADEALSIIAELAPQTIDHASVLYLMARVRSSSGQDAAALEVALESVGAIEASRTSLGGSFDSRTKFSSLTAPYYQLAVEMLIASDRGAEAFGLTERYRARTFLELLATRDLEYSNRLPEELDSRRRQLNSKYDQALDALATLPQSSEQAKAVLTALDELRAARAAVETEVREVSPGLAAIEYARPLVAADLDGLLDDGTLLLSYFIADEETFLFSASAASPLAVRPLGLPPRQLEALVGKWRLELEQTQSGSGISGKSNSSRRLGSLLIPDEIVDQVIASDRLLVLPDGALHLLPFSAVVVKAGDEERYLIELAPVVIAASVTSYSELVASRGTATGSGVTVFADPEQGDAIPTEQRGARLDLGPLPAAREEALSIRQTFPLTTEVWIGSEATESRVKAGISQDQIVHFAVHALVNGRLPLDSALVLSAVDDGGENGLLQAWEVFEQLRLQADLVTLSACRTAVGEVMGGEGVVGFIRAFQYAGARTVLATLWSVADSSTADLMADFYNGLKAGQTKEVALRNAQLAMLRKGRAEGGVLADPYHWAAFSVYGDWF